MGLRNWSGRPPPPLTRGYESMRQVMITEQGLHLHAEGESLLVSRGGVEVRRLRLGEVDSLALCGGVEISSGALAVLTHRGIALVFLTERGAFRGRLWTRHGPDVALRQRQMQLSLDPEFSIRIARRMIRAKVEQQRRILLRAQRRLKDEAVATALARLRVLAENTESVTEAPLLLGLEGEAAALYFRHFNQLILAPGMEFHGRSRRPPQDAPNACLSFGYTILGTLVETEVLRRGLDPFPGVFHEPRYNRPSLSLDLLEEFRPFIDTLTLRLINLRQLGPGDFENPVELTPEEVMLGEEGEPVDSLTSGSPMAARPAVHLNGTGRKVFFAEFYARLRDKYYHQPTDTTLELRDIITSQVNQLARCFRTGETDYQGFTLE